MTVTHLFFALSTTLSIFVAIQIEARDLMAKHPEYIDYQRQAPMIVPALPRDVVISKPILSSERRVYQAAADSGCSRASTSWSIKQYWPINQ